MADLPNGADSTVTQQTVCSQCGSVVASADRFCGSCGLSVSGPEPKPGASTISRAAEKRLRRIVNATAGDYEILRELGVGGMGAVYLAHDLRLDRTDAIKILLPSLDYSDGFAERFMDEARKMARLDHENIVRIYSFRETDEFIYFVMKYVDGVSLDKIIRADALLPIDIAQCLLGQAARALLHAHREGFLHRDVKPANILVDRRGKTLMTDFGIAKALDPGAPTLGLSLSGVLIGTPAYMSPEQCFGGRQLTAASDQYALGVVAFQMLTGHHPFNGPANELLLAHVGETPRRVDAVRPDCPTELADCIARMLEKSPADRWPSLADALPILTAGLPADDTSIRERAARIAIDAIPADEREVPVTPRSPAVPYGRPRAASTASKPPLTTVDPPPASVPTAEAEQPETTTRMPPSGVAESPVSPSPSGMAPARRRRVQWMAAVVVLALLVWLGARLIRPAVSESPARQPATSARTDPAPVKAGSPAVPKASPPAEPRAGKPAPSAPSTRADSGRAPAPTSPVAGSALAVRVQVDSLLRSMHVGERTVLSARVLGRGGVPVAGQVPRWSSSDPRIADVTPGGHLSARAPGGPVAITADVNGTRSTTQVTVIERPVARLEISLSRTTWTVGDTLVPNVRAYDAAGTDVRLTDVTLVSDNALVLDRMSSTAFLARGAGTASIVAMSGDVSAAAPVTVGARRAPTTTDTTARPGYARAPAAKSSPTPDSASSALTAPDAVVRSLVTDFADALARRDIRRLEASYFTGRRSALTLDFIRFVRDRTDLRLDGGQAKQVGVRGDASVVDFTLRMIWSAYRGARLQNRMAHFRGLARRSADGWTLSDVEVVERFW
jgi:serine/threonine protein kinase